MEVPRDYFVFKINVLKKLLLFTLGVCLASLAFGQKEFSLGFFMGGMLSMATFALLYKYVLQMRNFSASGRKKFIMARSLLIYLIMGLALFIGIKKGMATFLGVAAGFILLKIAVFMQAFQEKHVGA